MALQTMTSEQTYQLLFILATAIAGLIGAYVLIIKAQAKRIETEAEADKDTTTTQNVAVKLISDRFAKVDDLNTTLQKELRECEVRETEQAGTIRDLQRMNHELGERNEQQGKLMKQTFLELEATKRELQTVSAAFTAELARNGRAVNGDGKAEPP